MSSRSAYVVIQPALRRTPCRQTAVSTGPSFYSKLLLHARSRKSASQSRFWRHGKVAHTASRAALSAVGNGAEAEEDRSAQSRVPRTASKGSQRPAPQSVSKSRAKVSDKLKAAVKQVDKQVHEVIAVPVAHNVTLASHMHEHPGEDTCTLSSSTACERFSSVAGTGRQQHLYVLPCSDDGVQALTAVPPHPHRGHPGNGKSLPPKALPSCCMYPALMSSHSLAGMQQS